MIESPRFVPLARIGLDEKENDMDRYDKIAAYSRVMDKVDALRDVEANEDRDGVNGMDSFAFKKIDEAYQLLEDARDKV